MHKNNAERFFELAGEKQEYTLSITSEGFVVEENNNFSLITEVKY